MVVTFLRQLPFIGTVLSLPGIAGVSPHYFTPYPPPTPALLKYRPLAHLRLTLLGCRPHRRLPYISSIILIIPSHRKTTKLHAPYALGLRVPHPMTAASPCCSSHRLLHTRNAHWFWVLFLQRSTVASLTCMRSNIDGEPSGRAPVRVAMPISCLRSKQKSALPRPRRPHNEPVRLV